MKKSDPSLIEFWRDGGIGAKASLVFCAAFLLFLFFTFRLYLLLADGWFWLCAAWIGSLWAAYQAGKSNEKTRAQIERWEQIEATRSPEEKAALERKRVRDQVISQLKPEEIAVFAVPVPNEPKLAELERRVDQEVERILQRERERRI